MGSPTNIPVFRAAAELGVGVAAHAGEAVGASSVREVVGQLGVCRVGHGVRSIEDESVLDLLANNNVHLEVCPSCNNQIDVFNRYEDHPVDRLVRHGISVGINTDARGPTDLTLTQEYQRLHAVFGWQAEDFRVANILALEAAFIGDDLRRSLIARL